MQGADGVQPLTPEGRTQLLSAEQQMAEIGLRVLALGYRGVVQGEDQSRLEEGLTLTGLVGLDDPVRPEVPKAVERCRSAGIRVIMITGDHPRNGAGRGPADRTGAVRSPDRSETGERLGHLSDTQLQLLLDAPEIVFARTAPDQKMRIVQVLKRRGDIVAVTGDGVNDAPALKQADIGIAMGVTGTDVAREAADMFLTDDNFASIVVAVEEGRAIFENIRKFLTYVLTSNVPELVPYLAFVLLKVPLGLTVIQMLAVDLGTNLLPALALGAERPESDLMNRPPRRRTERLLRWPVLARVYGCLGAFEAAASMSAFFFVLHGGGWNYGQEISSRTPLYLEATTACLLAIVMMQVVNVFLCRSERETAFAYRPSKNPLILAGIAVEIMLILLIVYYPWGHAVFGTAPVSWQVWCFVLPFALALLAVEESRKWLARRLKTGLPHPACRLRGPAVSPGSNLLRPTPGETVNAG